jgi:hypothetical protein
MRFEYKIVTLTDQQGADQIEKKLNELGNEEWELAASLLKGGLPAFVLKRQVRPAGMGGRAA